MACWGCITAIVLLGLANTVLGALPHTTCKRTYKKVGGFMEVDGQRALTTMLLSDRDENSDVNDGHMLDWGKWSESLHSLACRCAVKAREKGWKVFGIQYYAECWSGPTAERDYNLHGPGSPTFQFLKKPIKPCNKNLDHECVGGEFVNYIYRLDDLDINGGYTKWSDWSSCTKSCGGGFKSRDRTCTNPKPAGKGRDCKHLGPHTEKAACNPHPCPTSSVNADGGWSNWSSWTKCSVSCGGGTQVHSRTCTNPRPQGIGKSCHGDAQETRACADNPCPPPCIKAMDVGLILDGSGSVKQENFNKALSFLAKLVSYFQVSPHGTHFGLITYSDNPTMAFTMADKRYHGLTALKQRLQSVPYPGGFTHTDRALLLAGLALFTPYGGDRHGRFNILVVFTDGKTGKDSRPYPEVLTPLQSKGVRTIAVGIGPEVDHEELLQIAMGDPNYVIHATSFDTLKDKLNSIRDDSCKGRPPPPVTPECHKSDPFGMASGTIPAPAITASSKLSENDGPELARLHLKENGKHSGAWSAKYNDMEQWLQVKFDKAVKLVSVASQGRVEKNYFVKSYWLSYSQDGEYFMPYTYKDRRVIFKGNKDRASVVTNTLPKPVYTRYIRVHPKSWSGHISMRLEVYGCNSGFSVPPVNRCYKRLGMEKGGISNSQIKASSEYSKAAVAAKARLYLHGSAWRAKTNDLNQWLQVELGPVTKVNIIATQGRQDGDQWVASYSVSFSSDAVFWDFYRQRQRTTIFSANLNRYSVVNQVLKPPIYARHIRIHPKTWHGAIAMRAEFYGCRFGFDLPPGPKCIEPLGMLTGAIPNAHITATSIKDQQSQPFFARLRLPVGAWTAKTNDLGQWLQIDIDKVAKITRIATQGSFRADQWVTSYTIEYSVDGGHYEPYDRVLEGNHDRTSISGHILYPGIKARYVRIRPKAWHVAISIRLEIYGCTSGFTPPTPKSCMKPLGVENGKISDSQLSASSQMSGSSGPSRGRLQLQAKSGMAGGWVAKTTNAKQWLGVDFYDSVKITRMSIQGRQDADQWVSSFGLKYSSDGYKYDAYEEEGVEKLFYGNKNRYTVVSHELKSPIVARYVRVVPKTWHKAIAMRVDFYGCKSGFVKPTEPKCAEPAGLEKYGILDSALSASSSWNIANHGPQWGRLNLVARGSRGGAWVARSNDAKQWFQVDLGGFSKVTRIAMQGRQNADDWVTRYTVKYSNDGKTFVSYQKDGIVKELQGNADRNTVVVSVLDPPIEQARYVRIVPKHWHNHIALRMELFVCKGAPIIPTQPPSCAGSIDLGIAIDCSGGVRLEDFQKVQSFLRKLVDKLHVSMQGNRMGIICYNDNTMPMVNFADTGSQSPDRMKTLISHIPYMFGGTRTDKALSFADTYLFSRSGGDRQDKPNVLLVLTDGKKSSNTAPYLTVLAPLMRKHVKVIAVGVGSNPQSSELLEITGQHKDRVLHMNDQNKLYSLLGNIAHGPCKPHPPPTRPPYPPYPPATPSSRCQHGWIAFKSNCYFFNHKKLNLNWYDCKESCRRLGGHLVDIHDNDEWTFVKNHLQDGAYSRQYFIGMRDEPLESLWIWQDGSLARFFKWSPGEPNGGYRENCGAMYSSSGLYHDSACTASHGNFVCKTKMP